MNEGNKTLKGGTQEVASRQSGESAQGAWKEGEEIINFDKITDAKAREKAIRYEGTFGSAQKRSPKRRRYIRCNWQRIVQAAADELPQ